MKLKEMGINKTISIDELSYLENMPPERYIIEGRKVFRYTGVEIDRRSGTFYTLDKPYESGVRFGFLTNPDLKSQVRALKDWVKQVIQKEIEDRKVGLGLREQIEKANTYKYNEYSIKDIEEILKNLELMQKKSNFNLYNAKPYEDTKTNYDNITNPFGNKL